ncbi:unnamed protein product [Moneuplotes crassus]|uniref:Uncharacterized protein n=1 Tax=Euplotes crassus TaxID=5936 RepID=A0AAD1XFI8_EUPCR|nr:unnamed protein product [Moneuplotes crassus]
MEVVNKTQYDENLSDELLSEEVSSGSIRHSEKILINMSENSLSNKKRKKNSFMSESSLNLLHEEEEFKKSDNLDSQKPKISSLNNQKRARNNSSQINYLKPNSSLKQEISHLLKHAALIRIRKMSENCEHKESSKEDLRK